MVAKLLSVKLPSPKFKFQGARDGSVEKVLIDVSIVTFSDAFAVDRKIRLIDSIKLNTVIFIKSFLCCLLF